MAHRKLKKIARWIKAEEYLLNPDVEIVHLLFDSRKYRDNTQTLFFALKGSHHNGYDYLIELYNRGVSNFVVEQIPKELRGKANFLLVKNSLTALQKLALKIRETSAATIISITGSNGKTILKEWLYQLLRSSFKVSRNPKSYNSQLGVPISIWELNKDDDYGIFEAGISQPGEMEKLEKILYPKIGIFTNIGSAHQENFDSLSQKIREKLKLFYNSKYLIFCEDHPEIKEEITLSDKLKQTTLFSWSFKDDSATVYVEKLEERSGQTHIHYIFNGQNYQATIPFTNSSSLENALHCLSLGLLTSFDSDLIAEKLSQMEPVAMRLELKNGQHGNIIINDAYNADLESLRIGLEYLSEQGQKRKKVLILSDILQTSLAPKELYWKVGRMLQSFKLDRVITVGEESKELQNYFEGNLQNYSSPEELLKALPGLYLQNSAVLLKGARVFHFEKIDALLEEKTHETTLMISLSHMVNNLNYYRRRLRPGVKIMAMVKAFGYGSGSHEIAGVLQYHKVDYLAVAYVDEGVELRKTGISLPIMVMNSEISSLDELLDYKLEPEIYSFRLLKAVSKKVMTEQLTDPYPIHLKLETGMHRLGFEKVDLPELTQQLKESPHLKIASVFSHLAAADDIAAKEYTLQQISIFKELTQFLSKELNQRFSRHILNSSGISYYPKAQFDMVRLGIGLYGISSDKEERKFLKPVSSLKATVSQIKQLQPGDAVGYKCSFKAKEPKTIATLSIGYADGFYRKLGNGIGEVAINGQRHKVVGEICMDMIMIDITGSEVREGDEAEIIGPVISIYELAEKMSTIPYEVLTGISQRVKRVYLIE